MFTSLILLTSLVFAAPKTATLVEGAPAPFDGTLLSAEAVAKILADANASDETCNVKIDLATEIERAKFNRDIDVLRSRNASCEKSLAELDKKHKALSLKYDRLSTALPVAAGVSFAGGIILTIIIAQSL